MDLVRPMRNRFATFLFVLYSSSITAQLFQPEKGGGGGVKMGVAIFISFCVSFLTTALILIRQITLSCSLAHVCKQKDQKYGNSLGLPAKF